MVSYIGSRRSRPSWWNDDEWAAAQHVNNNVLPHYFEAKVAADEYQTSLAKKRRDDGDDKFQSIILRPGSLIDDQATGKVKLGHTTSRGKITRADVAAVTVALLERDDTRGWFDLLQGEQGISEAVDHIVKEGIDCVEGEDHAKM